MRYSQFLTLLMRVVIPAGFAGIQLPLMAILQCMLNYKNNYTLHPFILDRMYPYFLYIQFYVQEAIGETRIRKLYILCL